MTASDGGEGDQEFVAGLRRRDELAFVTLLERYQAALFRLAQVYVPNPAIAEEVVQETWLGVFCGIDRFEGRSSLTTWLVAILINCARRRAAQEQRTRPLSTFRSLDLEAWEPTPEDAVLAAESREQIAAAIVVLPSRQRQVIVLRDVEGWTAAEACQRLALSAANQRVLLHRARGTVRRALGAGASRRTGAETASAPVDAIAVAI